MRPAVPPPGKKQQRLPGLHVKLPLLLGDGQHPLLHENQLEAVEHAVGVQQHHACAWIPATSAVAGSDSSNDSVSDMAAPFQKSRFPPPSYTFLQ
jgi:hypothetical protein